MLTKYSQFMILDSKLICSRERERGGGRTGLCTRLFCCILAGGGYCGGGGLLEGFLWTHSDDTATEIRRLWSLQNRKKCLILLKNKILKSLSGSYKSLSYNHFSYKRFWTKSHIAVTFDQTFAILSACRLALSSQHAIEAVLNLVRS